MINKKFNILVTGCGGDIGQSIGKILKESSLVNHLYGIDVTDKSPALFIYQNFFLGVSCDDLNYISVLESIVIEKHINIIIPASEYELRFFSINNLTKIADADIIMASSYALDIGFDKFKTAKFLENNKLPFPRTFLIQNIEVLNEFPMIMKSRTGSGSKNVVLIRDIDSFYSLKKWNKDFVIQEYLNGDNGEFTCCVFRSKFGEIRTIIFKRELLGGLTGYGEVIDDPQIDKLIRNVAVNLDLIGSINIQLRLTDKGPIIFEINPRFSSTVLFRDMLDFKDLIWSVEDKLNFKLSNYKPNSTIGKKIYKGFIEYVK